MSDKDDDDLAILEAHRREILEGLVDLPVDAAVDPVREITDKDKDSYAKFLKRWEEIGGTKPRNGRYGMKFGDGTLARVDVKTKCPHCGIVLGNGGSGISFVDPTTDRGKSILKDLAIFSLRAHCTDPGSSCKGSECRCSIFDEANPNLGRKRCQVCNLSNEDCICEDGATIGPCYLVEVEITVLDS